MHSFSKQFTGAMFPVRSIALLCNRSMHLLTTLFCNQLLIMSFSWLYNTPKHGHNGDSKTMMCIQDPYWPCTAVLDGLLVLRCFLVSWFCKQDNGRVVNGVNMQVRKINQWHLLLEPRSIWAECMVTTKASQPLPSRAQLVEWYLIRRHAAFNFIVLPVMLRRGGTNKWYLTKYTQGTHLSWSCAWLCFDGVATCNS